MNGVDNEESKGSFTQYSVIDYLNTRERTWLNKTVGTIIGHIKIGKVVF